MRVLDFAHADRHNTRDAIEDADLVLTTYGTLRRDVAALRNTCSTMSSWTRRKRSRTRQRPLPRPLDYCARVIDSRSPAHPSRIIWRASLFDFLNPGLLGDGRYLNGARGARGARCRWCKWCRWCLRRRIRGSARAGVAALLSAPHQRTRHAGIAGAHRGDAALRARRRAASNLSAAARPLSQLASKTIERDGFARSKFQILEALLRLRQAACHTSLLPAVRSGDSAKFDLLLPRLIEVVGEGRKALVFSQFTSLLALLKPQLDAEHVAYEYLDGQTRDREIASRDLQEDSRCSLFLISLKAGGVGLNLTASMCSCSIPGGTLPSKCRPSIARIASAREKPVFAYRLVARDTVEERILQLQSHKRALADAILQPGSRGLRGLQREDLELLLS